jgi:lipoprotein-anchoring transpeptidase ErfK/SrfK
MTRIASQLESKLNKKLSKGTRNVVRNVALAILALLVARVAAAAQEVVAKASEPAQATAPLAQSAQTESIGEPGAKPQDSAAPEDIASAEPRRQIIVSLPDRKLALLENDEVVKVYAVAIGKGTSPTPAGDFEIVNRLENPTYYHPHVVIGPGPQNPLGTRWIGLNKKGFGIHGTNEPRSIGKAASHGCIRMAKADLEELFTRVRPGDEVLIRGERDEDVAAIFGGDEPVAVADAATTATSVDTNGNQ